MARFWAPLLLLLWGSSSYAFQLAPASNHGRFISSMDSRVVLHASDDDFATSRVSQRLAAEARRKADMERRAREEAARLADEARRAEEALKRAAREAASKQMKDGKVVEMAKVSASEASQWALSRVEERMWNQGIKKAAEQRRQIVEQARFNADAESEYKTAKSERAVWAKQMVDARLQNQARKMLLGREQIMMLSLNALQNEKNRVLADKAIQAKKEQLARRAWAAERVTKRIRIQGEKQAIIDQMNFEIGLAIAMQMRNGEASRRKAMKEQERMAARSERARWAASRVEARQKKAAAQAQS